MMLSQEKMFKCYKSRSYNDINYIIQIALTLTILDNYYGTDT